jgi:uncharacterized protein (DUF427 family)
VSFQRIEPQPGQESVWDYPRPPALQKSDKQIRVVFNNLEIACTRGAYRVLETSHPPVYYIPLEDITPGVLVASQRSSFCEYKGMASYWTVKVGDRMAVDAAWSYPSPSANFMPIKGYIAFYPGRMEACYVDEQQVQAQAGDFYGGWITPEIVGPFKGGAGTWGW